MALQRFFSVELFFTILAFVLARMGRGVGLANILTGKLLLAYFTFENVFEIFLVLVQVLFGDKRSLAVATLMEFLVHKLVNHQCLGPIKVFLANAASESSVLARS